MELITKSCQDAAGDLQMLLGPSVFLRHGLLRLVELRLQLAQQFPMHASSSPSPDNKDKEHHQHRKGAQANETRELVAGLYRWGRQAAEQIERGGQGECGKE